MAGVSAENPAAVSPTPPEAAVSPTSAETAVSPTSAETEVGTSQTNSSAVPSPAVSDGQAQNGGAPDPEPVRRGPVAALTRPQQGLGQLGLIALISGTGLCLCSLADALSRATLNPSLWLLWLGIALVVGPTVYRLCSADASVAERTALVILFGLSLYAVKMMRDPFGFTLPDEPLHAHNAQQILATHHLFGSNPMLGVSTRYPGLEGATSALMFLTGMSSFGAGTLFVGACQLTLMVGLFVLFMAVSGSARVAGLGAVAYAGNSNFLYFGAMFSYESLALPLLVVVIALVALRVNTRGVKRQVFALPIVVLTLAIAITHHLTSYLLDGVLVVLAAAPRVLRRRLRPLGITRFALWALFVTLAWLVVVASETVGYISPVVTTAFVQTIDTLTGDSPGRAPFSGGPGGVSTPVAERVVSLGAVVILLIALPFGLRAVWRRHKRDPVALLLGVGAIGYFAVLGLRLSPTAWEIANRTDEYAFIGLGFAAAYAVAIWMKRPQRWPRLSRAVVGVATSLVVIGGAIAGYTINDILTPPTLIRADGRDIPSQAVAVGQWIGRNMRGDSFAAPDADARMILLYGGVRVLSGGTSGIDYLLTAPTLTGTDPLGILARHHLRYAVVDRRERGTDNFNGYGFSVRPAGGAPDKMLPVGVATKFDDLPASQVYDSGDISIYDLRGVE